MHSGYSSRARSLIHLRCRSRSASTAAALKSTPHDLGKWGSAQPAVSERRSTSRAAPNLGKWAKPSQPPHRVPNGSGPSYRPNVSKWARSEPVATSTPGRSILDALNAPRRSSGRQNVVDGSKRSGSSFSQDYPEFPSDVGHQRASRTPGSRPSYGDKLQRDAAPHLASYMQKRTDSQPFPEKLESDAQNEHQNVKSDVQRIARGPPSTPKKLEYMEDLDSELSNQVDAEREPVRRLRRQAHKERGSLIERLEAGEDIEIPSRSRAHHDHSELAKKAKKKVKKKPVVVDVAIPSVVSVENLARLLDVRLETLQLCMQKNGMEELSSHDHMLPADDASLLAMEFNRNPIIDDEAAFDIYPLPPHPDQASLPRRPPVVTIMGHVDHGKTTLLDTLRSSSVAKGEAGGITQHIGAFSVPVPSNMNSSDSPQTITFLDTPGHAAFSAMRARGAHVTDIVVLVVAADDGVMPQTKEVIELIKKEKGKVGVVVAINKVDKPGADIEKVHNALWAEGIELEVMGGDVPSVEVSGLTGQGLEDLVETISLLAELQDIRAEADGPAQGYVLESKVAKGFGSTATVLLLRGKLTSSSHIISGTTHAKVRRLVDSSGATVKSAGPGSAVVVSGWKELPSAGDEVLQGKESDIKLAVENRKRKASLAATLADAEAINASRRLEREERERAKEAVENNGREPVLPAVDESGHKELRLIIKGDVSGSVEALAGAVQGIGNKDAVVKVVSTGVGEVTESDVMLAKASEGIIIAFSVDVSRIAERAASQNEVPIYRSEVIYSVLDEVKERVIQLLPKIVETRVTAETNVIEIFEISGKSKSIIKVAGCRVSNGIVQKDKRVRVLREGKVVHDGTLSTLRILKRDVLEVKKGLECGISINDFSDLRAGDFLQFYHEIEKPGQL